MESGEPDPLVEETRQTERALESTLTEACAAEPASGASTGELIRLHELLSEANEAAKHAISLRRKRRAHGAARQAARAAMIEVEAQLEGDATHRIFRDARGVRWDVFAVHPAPEILERARLRGSFSKGWLCFHGGSEKRRLSPIPDDWFHMSNEQLAALAQHAEVAMRM